ncbi:dynamin family protein [Leptolyngbya sp. CCY15150]|uniref:dynamin family protein n=1 Tax=Leptolyngbya sp. CCY15150 TaxID=2767772 RepID=UPI001951BFC1|nr:dynamin family protein [Leptolyngbya sp. CCY15150]
MTTASYSQETISLLSDIVGQPVTSQQINPKLLFMTALVTAMLGALCADGVVVEEEKETFQKIFNQFFPSESKMGQLVRGLKKSVQQRGLFQDPSHLSLLVQGLSESEKLLVLAFACEIATADSDVVAEEMHYLQKVSGHLELRSDYLETLLSAFQSQSQSADPNSVFDVHNLLDPSRFQAHDFVFVRIADYITSKLPKTHDVHISGEASALSYKQLENFKVDQDRLRHLCQSLLSITQDYEENVCQIPGQAQDILSLLDQVRNQKFRVAVVGEFSQGKSTLLNALLGEEIQPVRAIPCSGTVTVLRFGEKTRVLCVYTDGRQEEIPFENYQEKASISEQAALCGLSDELGQSTIQEIILEHPSLELCRHNVEIVDSPGLNEHPNRTEITQRLLQKTDAAIFLANASRPLTQGERLLLEDLRSQLNRGDQDSPADNLFVLVNFMDLLRRQSDRKQVRQLVENFLQGSNPIVSGDNRVHFISAQAALDAIIEGEGNEFLESFKAFTSALERFLIHDRGMIVVRHNARQLKTIAQKFQEQLQQSLKTLDDNIQLVESDKRKIVDQIGEVSSRDFKIRALAQSLANKVFDQVTEGWQGWTLEIGGEIRQKSATWKTEHHQKDKITRDFSNQFIQDISHEIDTRLEREVVHNILSPNLDALDDFILDEMCAIQANLEALDSKIGSTLGGQFNLSLKNLGINVNFSNSLNPAEGSGFMGFLGFGGGSGLLSGIALAGLGVSFVPVLLIGAAAGVIIGWLTSSSTEENCRNEVLQKGLKHFSNSSDELLDKVTDTIQAAFDGRVEASSKAVRQSISILNLFLEEQERITHETVENRESEKAYVHQCLGRLSQLQRDLEFLVSDA